MIELGVVFLFGLVGGLHCLGMCGPIVLAYSLPLSAGRLRAHAGYHAGRILTYMALGAAAGAAGGWIGALSKVAVAARLAAGAVMIATGVLLAFPLKNRPKLIQIRAGKMVHGNKLALGLALGFLPCGLIYAALLKAVDAASAASGALTMLAFGLGTAVPLLGMGAVSAVAGPRLGRWSNRLAAVSVIAAGAVLLWRGIAAAPYCHG